MCNDLGIECDASLGPCCFQKAFGVFLKEECLLIVLQPAVNVDLKGFALFQKAAKHV